MKRQPPIISVEHMRKACDRFVKRCMTTLVEKHLLDSDVAPLVTYDMAIACEKLWKTYGHNQYKRRSSIEVGGYLQKSLNRQAMLYVSFFVNVIDGEEAIRLKLHAKYDNDVRNKGRKRLAWMKLAERYVTKPKDSTIQKNIDNGNN